MKHYLNYFDKLDLGSSSDESTDNNKKEINIQDIEFKPQEIEEEINESSSNNSETRVEDDILGLKKYWLELTEKDHSYSSTHFWISHLEDGMRKLLHKKLSLYDMKSP